MVVVAIVTRFLALGKVPHGMTWDEAAIGYNGYAIVTMRRDEWLQKLPISFKSFGDYKAPLAIYLNGFFTLVFGMELWAVRLPFALAGVGTVIGMYFLAELVFLTRMVDENTQETLKQLKKKGILSYFWLEHRYAYVSVAVAGMLAVSPWHLHYSRTGFESGLALFCLVWGLVAWHWFRAQQLGNTTTVWLFRVVPLLLFFTAFSVSLYTYHSAKIVMPLLGSILVILDRKIIRQSIPAFLLGMILSVLITGPLVYDSLFGNGLERSGTLLFLTAASWQQGATQFLTQFFDHFSVPFLLLGKTPTLRHGSGAWGVLLPTTFLLGVAAIVLSGWKKKLSGARLLALGLVVIGILPAALGNDGSPHSNRALLALPGFLILAGVGAEQIRLHFKKSSRSVLLVVLFLHVLFFGLQQRQYYTVFAAESSDAFKDGYIDLFKTFKLDADHSKVFFELDGKTVTPQQVIVTDVYGQPYIYALFSHQLNPQQYQWGVLNAYTFRSIQSADAELENAIVVTSPEETLNNLQPIKTVTGSDGQPRFFIYYLPVHEAE